MTKSESKSNSWYNSFNSLWEDISEIEITTAIADEITEDVFIPYEVYQEIYAISPSYLAESSISEQLHPRYLRLRRQLELQYALLLCDENSILYDSRSAAAIQQDLPLLARDSTPWESLPCRLPPPVGSKMEEGVLNKLLVEPSFKAVLRQLGSVKASLDRQNQLTGNTNNNSDSIYARTTIRLDGKIMNRYAAEILQHPQQKEILNLHQMGVVAGEKQWSKLRQFAVKFIQMSRKF